MRALPLFLAFALTGTAAAAASPIEGLWLTDDHKGVVRIAPCGARLCGRIARVLDSGPGVPTRDANNPDPRLRGRPILGLPVLSGFRSAGDRWAGGQAYDPKTGRSYRATLSLAPDGSLTIVGCVMVVCRTKHWTRAR